MRKVYLGFTVVLMLGIVAQFYFAAVGAFDTAPKDESFEIHRFLGYAILLWALLTTIVAALARMPGAVIGRVALVAGLTLVQSLIAVLANAMDSGDTTTTSGQLVFGLHALNALAIMGVAGAALSRGRELVRMPTPVA